MQPTVAYVFYVLFLSSILLERYSMAEKRKINYEEVSGTRIRFIRECYGLKQKDLADLLHVSRQEISNYENGNRPITVDQAKILAGHFRVSLDYLCCNDHTEYALLFLPVSPDDPRAELFQKLLLEFCKHTNEENE